MTASRSLSLNVTSSSTLVLTMNTNAASGNGPFATYNMGGDAANDVGTNAAAPKYNAAINNFGGASALTIGIFSDFPNHTKWTWTAGTTTNNGSPRAYPALDYSNAFWAFQSCTHPATPHLPLDASFANVTLTINQTFNISQPDGIDWLVECVSATVAVPPDPPPHDNSLDVHEIGLYTYAPPGLVGFIQSGTHNFDATLSDGMNIRCYTTGGGDGVPFVVVYATTTLGGSTVVNLCDGQTRTIRIGEILGLMATHGTITNTEWILGFSSGPEVYAGTGSGVCSVYQWNNWP